MGGARGNKTVAFDVRPTLDGERTREAAVVKTNDANVMSDDKRIMSAREGFHWGVRHIDGSSPPGALTCDKLFIECCHDSGLPKS